MTEARRWFPITTALCLLVACPALAADDTSKSVFQMFFVPVDFQEVNWADIMGLLIIWCLVLLSVLSIGLAGSLASRYRRPTMLPSDTREQLETMLSNRQYREAIEFANTDDSYLGRVTAAALNEAANGFSAMERAVEEAGDAEATRILRPIEYLNVLGNISPMLGLFGTVFGMIVAFQALVAAGGQADPVKLADGISTALVTTFWGLVVAIPALAAYALIRNRVDAICAEGLLLAEELISPFKPGLKKAFTGDKARGSDPGSGGVRPRATPKPEA